MVDNDAAMLIARMIVEAHINTWGMVPHPDYLKEAIAASLRKAEKVPLIEWNRMHVAARPTPAAEGESR